MPKTLPLILLPGLGADRRLLHNQASAFSGLIVPDWLPPKPADTLPSYAQRLAEANDPGGPCFVGGVSLGGMLAQEMTKHLDARACFIISSIRSARELPFRIRVLGPLRPVLSGVFFWSLGRLARAALFAPASFLTPNRRSCLDQFISADPAFMRWAARAVLQWVPEKTARDVPMLHIHGDCDRLLPHGLTHPDVVVPGAGHLMVLTHPEAVNEFLRAGMDRYGPVQDE